MPAAIFVLMDESSRVLMETRGQGDKYFPSGTVFPGGKLLPDELPWMALLRETWEEAGVIARRWYRIWQEQYIYYLPVPEEIKSMGGDAVRFASPTPVQELEDFEVFAFLITQWDGEVSPVVRDTGNRLDWVELPHARTGYGCTGVITDGIYRLHARGLTKDQPWLHWPVYQPEDGSVRYD